MSGKIRTFEGHGPEKDIEPLAIGGGNIRSPLTTIERALEQLWTAEQFEAAEPYPMEIDDEILKQAKIALEPRGKTGAEGILAGGLPEEVAEQPTDVEPAATSGGYNYPGPYTRHNVLCEGKSPYITIGKLFFKQYGKSYVASAASIGNYAIWTAGHCVHAGDGKPEGWSTNLVFVPAYKNGKAPYGQWPASYLTTRTAWYKNGNPNGFCEDMAGAILHPQGGKKISQAVGWLGFAWNWSRYQHWHAIGYPAAAPFNGAIMVETEASFAYIDSSLSCNPKPTAIGCDMTGGCSGGPWILQFGTNNYLNGNNSYRHTDRPEEMNSPFFGNEAKDLFDTLIKSTP